MGLNVSVMNESMNEMVYEMNHILMDHSFKFNLNCHFVCCNIHFHFIILNRFST